MNVNFHAKILVIDGLSISMPWVVLDAVEEGGKIFILLDPNSYLLNSDYKKQRRKGLPAIKNLLAVDKTGLKLWEAELPTTSDYYYKFNSISPLIVNSFSSFRCEIDTENGEIKNMEFLK